MPTYDYKCNDCSHEFEAFQSMSADLLKDCPECGNGSLKRLIGTGAGLVFKGTGFYETDYKKSSSSESGSGSESKDTKKESSPTTAEKKTETSSTKTTTSSDSTK